MSSDVSKPIAYLTATFPSLSHTFILREILALEKAGFRIEPISVRKPKNVIGVGELQMMKRTHYLLNEARNPLKLVLTQLSGLSKFSSYLEAVRLAWRTRPAGIRASIFQVIYFAEAVLLARHIKQRGCRHLHNHFANSSCTVAMLASKLAKVPFSFTLHGPSDLFEAKHWRLDQKIAEAEFVACISHFARSQAMLNSDPEYWSKLRIVHCGVEPDEYKSQPIGSEQATRLIFVGRLAAVKGLPVLFKAFERAIKSNPDLELTIVGDGPDRDSLMKLAGPHGSAIRFTGPLSQADVALELSRSDMMVLPSFAEGVPVVLMEAMASELPVIATQVAGVSELVQDNVSGLMVAPGDEEGLHDAIVRLANEKDVRTRMGRAGRKKVLADFHIQKEAEWLGQILKGEAGERLRPSPPESSE